MPGTRSASDSPGSDVDLTQPGSSGRIRLLLVEDDTRFAELVQAVLAETGPEFEIVHARQLSTALACLVRQRIGLILTDLHLPDSQGAATVRYLVRAAPNVPVVVLSGNDDIDLALEAIHEGADEFLVKGRLDAGSLVRLLRLASERRRRVAEQWAGTGETQEARDELGLLGSHLLKVADRTRLHVNMLLMRVTRLGLGSDRAPLAEIAGIVEHTLRRCDLVLRVDDDELAVILVGDRPGIGGAPDRLGTALAGREEVDVRVGFSSYDPAHPESIDELLARAREGLQPLTNGAV